MDLLPDFAARFFTIWPTIFVFDLGRYLVTAGVFAAVLHFLARSLVRRRIRAGEPPAGQRLAEIAASIRTALVFSIVGFGIHTGAIHGLLPIYQDIAERGWTYFVASIAFAIVAHDAYFYWTHRAMHHPALYRWFHRRHHRSVQPTPWTAYAFDVPEAIVQAMFWPLFLAVVPMHGLAIFLFLSHMIVRNVMGHCGYELMPRWLDRSEALGWLTSVTHHDLHHETFRWNYGLYFTWWDRWMGTEHPEYRARLEGKVAALSVLAVVLLAGLPQPAEAADVHGEWATQGYSARVRIAPCAGEQGPGRACGIVTWLWSPRDASGKEVRDESNPDEKLRSRPIVGIPLLRGFRRGEGGEWIDGSIYNPEDGRTYAATMRLGTAGELRVRGCALGVFCQTQVWRRVEELCR